MAKKKNESLLSDKDMKTLQKDLDKKLAKIKPRPREVSKIKSKVTRTQTKAENPKDVKDIRTMIKDDLKDEFEEVYLQSKVNEFKQKTQQFRQPQVIQNPAYPQYIPNPQNPTQLIPNPALVVQQPRKEQSLIDKLPAGDLKNMTPDQIENLKELEIIRQKPELAYLKDDRKNQQPQQDPVETVKAIVEVAKSMVPSPPDNSVNNIVQGLLKDTIAIIKNGNQPSQTLSDTVDQIKNIQQAFQQPQQSGMNQTVIDLLSSNLNKAYEEIKTIRNTREAELLKQADADPVEQLRYMMESINIMKEQGMGGFGSDDLEKKMAMDQHEFNIWKQKREIEIQDLERTNENKKSDDVLTFLGTALDKFSDKIIGVLGGAMGNQMGNQVAPMTPMQDPSFQNPQIQPPYQVQEQPQLRLPPPQYQPIIPANQPNNYDDDEEDYDNKEKSIKKYGMGFRLITPKR